MFPQLSSLRDCRISISLTWECPVFCYPGNNSFRDTAQTHACACACTHTHTHTHTHMLAPPLRENVQCSTQSLWSSLRPTGRQPARLLCPWDSPGRNTGVGCSTLLRERKYGVLSWIDANVKSVLAFKIFLICFKNIPPQNVTIAKDKWKLERLALSL